MPAHKVRASESQFDATSAVTMFRNLNMALTALVTASDQQTRSVQSTYFGTYGIDWD